MERPTGPRRTGMFQNPLLRESSGVAASRHQPGVLWTFNDSGNDALIFATDTLGRDLGAFTVVGAENQDWEAISLGPCATGDCLYIGDTGDNGRGRPTSRIYRIPEPAVPGDKLKTRRADVLEFRYPNGPRDVEAVFVGLDRTIYLASKVSNGPSSAFRIRPEAWKRGSIPTAESIGKLPIDGGNLGNQVTDAALDPTGARVAVRTYLAVYLFDLTPEGTLIPTDVACDAAGLQLQGEGISWLDDRVLVLTSENGFGRPGTVVLLECGGARVNH